MRSRAVYTQAAHPNDSHVRVVENVVLLGFFASLMRIALSTSHRLTSAALVAAALLTLAAPGCGDSDENADTSQGTVQEQTTVAGKPSAPNRNKPNGPTLSGDATQAREAARATDSAYSKLGAAVTGPLTAAGTLRDTLAAAEGNPGLVNFCKLMSEDAKREAVAYAKESGGLVDVKWTCEKSVALLLRRAKSAGSLKRSLNAKIVAVNADPDSDRATATIQFGGKGPLSTVPLVREDGKWKLGTMVQSESQ